MHEHVCDSRSDSYMFVVAHLSVFMHLMHVGIENLLPYLCRETSDLIYCVADLQFTNQKLQDDIRKLKQAMELMEDTNQKLIEENEDLKSQARVYENLPVFSCSSSPSLSLYLNFGTPISLAVSSCHVL